MVYPEQTLLLIHQSNRHCCLYHWSMRHPSYVPYLVDSMYLWMSLCYCLCSCIEIFEVSSFWFVSGSMIFFFNNGFNSFQEFLPVANEFDGGTCNKNLRNKGLLENHTYKSRGED
jgi:hypothetical protein